MFPMASADYKLHKTELVALYKLEFYKKQKNWKFAYDVKKTPRSKYTKTRKAMNETYEIETPDNDELSSINNAFLDDVPDKDVEPPSQMPGSANMACGEAGYSRPWSEHFSEPERDDQRWWDVEQEPVWEDPPIQEYEDCLGESAGFPYDAVDAPPPYLQDLQLEELANAIERCARLIGFSAQFTDQSASAETDLDTSSESLAQFMQGAHLAPHSSEIDLRDHTLCGGGVGGGGAGCVPRLSPRALRARLTLHAEALVGLLRETALRNRNKLNRTCSELLPGVQWGEVPGPCEQVWRQGLVAGGGGGGGGTGRGRGLLQRRRVVGVNMGRPYRL